MNKITALERVNVLYSVIYAGQNSNINNIRLRSSILLYIKQSGIVLKINNGKDIIPHKDSVFLLIKVQLLRCRRKKVNHMIFTTFL